VFEDHILPELSATVELTCRPEAGVGVWQKDIGAVVMAKLKDEERYQAELQSLFDSKGQTETS
jgi:hypothetical protein